MSFFKRLGVGLVALLALLSTAVLSTPLLSQRVEAASTYSYADGSSLCANFGGGSIAIVETADPVNGVSPTYAWCHQPNTTYEFTRGTTGDTITVADTDPSQGTLNASSQTSSIVISNTQQFAQAFPNTVTQQQANQPQSCEDVGNWAWLACPLINMMSGAINWLDERIQNMLEVGQDRYSNDQLRQAWVNFRNIAYIVLIPVMMVMVISTALSMEMFSAYTVKKALPRMAVAIVFITLSWYITTFLIGFANTVGGGILGLMTSPFGIDGNMSLDTLFGASSGNAGDVASTTASAAVQWAATLGPLFGLYLLVTTPGGLAILLFYLMPIVGTILVAFIVLLLREIFILGAVLLAPLAILAWIFPGNDKPWKLWWGMFSKLLMMFPMIMVVIGAGRIAAYMIDISGGGGAQSIVNPLLKLTAYVLPYMIIPFTFKFAGGVFANLSGMINDREKGLFDRVKKKRGEMVGEFARRGGRNSLHDQERVKSATGFKKWRMNATNQIGGWIFDPVSNAHVALGTEKGKAIMSYVWSGKMEDSQKLAEVLSKMSFNAEELSALSLGRNIKVRNAQGQIENRWIERWTGTGDDLYRIADQLSSSTDEQDRIGGRHLRENAAFLTQVTRSEEYGRADYRAATGLAYAAQGFATPEEIRILANELGEDGSGVGSIFKTQAELLSARGGGLGKPGYGIRLDADGNYYAPTGIDGAKIEQVVRTGVQDFSAAKGSQLSKQLEEALTHIMTASPDTTWVTASGETSTIGSIRTGVEETLIQVMGSYAAPDVKRRVYGMLVEGRTTRNVDSGMTAEDARATAETEIQNLLRRGSGNFNINEFNAQQQQNNEDH